MNLSAKLKRAVVMASTAVLLGLVAPMTALAAYPNVTAQPGLMGPGATGWTQAEDGTWSFYNSGRKIASEWAEIGDHWYFFNDNGTMLTGWQDISESWYYLTEEEAEGHPVGSLYVNGETPDGCTVDENGVKIADAVDPSQRPNPYGYSCVEVDITNQMVYLYIDKKLEVETPCVSGLRGVSDTTCGTHKIYSKERNRTLRGYNRNGTRYASFVNFWMPFHGGEGLHDANWRGTNPANFGGNRYVTGGSHGCVNLPYDAAAAIYNLSYVGMPVIVHK